MSRLLCLGLGYCARHYAAGCGRRFGSIAGTSRDPKPVRGVDMIGFSGAEPSQPLRAAIEAATHVLISAGPDEMGDPILRTLGERLAEARQLESVVYLSSTGVYGDHGGAWVDETATTVPAHLRGGARLRAEQSWEAFGAAHGVPVAILRLAGIYGPGQNVFVRLLAGRAQRVAKPGHVFNRIHVADIAQAIDAAFSRKVQGIFNVADGEPAPYSDNILFAANLLGIEPPPELSWDEAEKVMSPMALSFYADCVRVGNGRLRRDLGVTLRYPNWREGLSALFAEGYEARDPLA